MPRLGQAQCPTGDVFLRSQTEVNAFPAGCANLPGSLTIKGDDITDLSPLDGLQSVGGYLFILNNPELPSLTGLGNLTEVGGFLNIRSNDKLTSLDGLSKLTRVGGYLTMAFNPELTSLTGLDNLTEVGGYLGLSLNAKLASLAALSKLTRIGGGLYISNNPVLSQCAAEAICQYLAAPPGEVSIYGNATGCNSEDEVKSLCGPQCPTGGVTLATQAQVNAFPAGCPTIPGNLTINGNDIVDLSPLNELQSVGKNLSITNNPELISLTGLDNMTEVGGSLYLSQNAKLTSLAGLGKLTRVGNDLFITQNPELTSLTGLDNLTEVGANLTLSQNAKLTSLAGLSKLTRLVEALSIHDNPELTSLTGLDNLTEVGGIFFLYSNAKLTSLAALSKLTRVGNDLNIYKNPELTSLTGLDNLTEVGRAFYLYENAKLTSLAGLSKLTHVAGLLNISDNPALTSLAGLDNLTEVGGYFQLSRNVKITSLAAALSKLTRIGGNLYINFNPDLSQCAIAAICQYLAAPAGSVGINNNATGCNSVAEVQSQCSALTITTQPAPAATVCAGADVTASVSVTGSDPAYQWYKGEQALTSQISATLTLTNVQPTDAGPYRVVVSNSTASVTSTNFLLTVKPIPASPSLSASPATTTTNQPITVTANGCAGTLSWTPTGGTGASNGNQYTFTAPGSYSLTATCTVDGCTSAPSESIALTINACPDVAATLSGTTAVCAGSSADLSMAITGGVAPYSVTYSDGTIGTMVDNYQSGNSITVSSASTTTYSLVSATDANGCAATVSGSAIITVNPLPTASISTNSGPVCVGGNSSFTVSGSSGATLTYTLTGLSGNQTLLLDGGNQTITASAATSNATLTLVSVANANCSQNLTGTSTVTINPLPTLTPGPDKSVVLGYGNSCTEISATASGGGGDYTYAWTPGNLSGQAVTVCPTATTTYEVKATDAKGCTSLPAQVKVSVQDVRCGNKNQNVTICYYGVTQCVSEKVAERYLKLGAKLGGCGTGGARIGVEENSDLPLSLSLKAYPNPAQDLVTVQVLAPRAGTATFEVLDVAGVSRQSRREELVEGLNRVELRLGTLPAGLYLIRALDAQNRQGVVRLKKE